MKRKIFWSIFEYTIAAGLIAMIICTRLFSVSDPSMQPALIEDDCLIAAAPGVMGTLEPGDIILLAKESYMEGATIVRRIVATEGQTLEIKKDTNGEPAVFVDGEKLPGIYIAAGTKWTPLRTTIEKNHVFVLGNQNAPADSRTFGQVHTDEIKGKILYLFIPGKENGSRDWSRFGKIE